MKHTFKFLGLGAGIIGFSIFSACSSGTGNPATADAGNSAGTGGNTSTSTGTTGGSTSTGTGTGGTPSNGGSTSCPTTTLFAFDNDASGFTLDTTVGNSVDTQDDSGKGMTYVNLAAPGDAGVTTLPQLGWSNLQDYITGSTTKGALAITATYSQWNQSLAPQAQGLVDSGGNVIDFINKVITFHVMITGDGLTTNTNAGGGFVFLKTGSAYTWGQGPWTSIVGTGSWLTLSINTKSPDQTNAGWDPAAPKQLGIQISSSGGGGSAAAPNAYGAPRNVIIYIDYITVTCAP